MKRVLVPSVLYPLRYNGYEVGQRLDESREFSPGSLISFHRGVYRVGSVCIVRKVKDKTEKKTDVVVLDVVGH